MYKKLLFIWYIRKSNSPYPCVYKKLLFIWYIRKSNSQYPYMCTKNFCLSDILGKSTVNILTCVHAYKKLLFIWYIRKSNSPYPYVCTKNSCLSDILGKTKQRSISLRVYMHTKNSCLSDTLGKATVHILLCVHAYRKLLFIWYVFICYASCFLFLNCSPNLTPFQGERISHAVGCAFAACLAKKQAQNQQNQSNLQVCTNLTLNFPMRNKVFFK